MVEQAPERKTTKDCCAVDWSNKLADGRLAAGAKIFKALADVTRLAILRLLRERGEVCACEFLSYSELAQPTVAYHLKVLRDAGLVRAVKRGLWVHYSLDEKRLGDVKGLLP